MNFLQFLSQSRLWLFSIAVFAVFGCSSPSGPKDSVGLSTPSYPLPTLKTNDTEVDTAAMAFNIAVGNLVSNIRPYKGGLLNEETPCLLAGMDYYGPWSRDAAYNCMNAGSLLFPDIARKTLLSQMKKDEKGRLVFAGEYWDNNILGYTFRQHATMHNDDSLWMLGKVALKNTLADRERDEFDSVLGLFRGASYFNDGISGYPDLYARTGKYEGGQWVSNIKKWVELPENAPIKAKKGFGLPMMCLSTNAIYYQAYRLLAENSDGESRKEYSKKADALKAAINRHLWNATKKQYKYFIDPNGDSEAQEAMGLAMVLQTDIADEHAKDVMQNAYITAAGMPCLWPSYSRYTIGKAGEHYGRHSGTVWAHVQATWARATLKHKRPDLFLFEYTTLTNEIFRDKQCLEIYHPITTLPYGGMQEDNDGKMSLWKSATVQTWTASAYVGMVLTDILGLRIDGDSIAFGPTLIGHFPHLRLQNLCIAAMQIDVEMIGSGKQIESISLNGAIVPEAKLNKLATGKQKIIFKLKL